MLKKLVVWGWNNNEKGQTGGKIYMKITVSRKSQQRLWKLNVEKAGVLGVKRTLRKDKQEGKIYIKINVSRIHQINRKDQVNNMDFKNQLERWKCWWFRSQKQENKGQTMVKIYMKMNVSRIPPNQ